MVSKAEVINANKDFYNAMAETYEVVDGRRSPAMEKWLKSALINIRKRNNGSFLLDIGTGSGFVTRCAENIYENRVGLDISELILSKNKDSFDLGVCADPEKMPFKDASFDAVTCFAVLHHLFDFEGIVKEVSRVLKPGGIFYSDHDMDSVFYNRYKMPLNIYRKIQNHSAKYKKSNSRVTDEMYKLSEWNEKGIKSDEIDILLKKYSFEVERSFHWYGLNPLTDLFFGKRNFNEGNAPLVSFLAVKQ